MRRRSLDFVPSLYSDYGAAEPSEDEALPLEEIIIGAKAFLGIDDPRKNITRLRNRLRDLEHGNPAERTSAMLAAASPFSLQGAITKTETKLRELESAAFQTKTRDGLYTALVITGVAAGGMLAVWFAANAYAKVQDAKIRQLEYKQLRG
jgi:hypothetical protein